MLELVVIVAGIVVIGLLAGRARRAPQAKLLDIGGNPSDPPLPPSPAGLAARPARIDGRPAFSDWQQFKLGSSEPLPPELVIAGSVWVLRDQLDLMTDRAAEVAHGFEIVGASDAYRSHQVLQYPDGKRIDDEGRVHVGGYSAYRIGNLRPGYDLAIVRRVDLVYGAHEVEYLVDGCSAGADQVDGSDYRHRWRNWPYIVRGDLVTQSEISVRQVAKTANSDVSTFHLWCYQRA